MSSLHQVRRAEEKLATLFDQIGAVRFRLNSLAWQRGLFGALGWTIGLAAMVALGAFYLKPLTFLITSMTLGVIAVAGVANSLRAAWLMHVNRSAAALIADRRADLKGRLETIVEIGQRLKVARLGHPQAHPLLWSYLIEDTLNRQDDFAPAHIEARRVSRAIYGLIGSLALAAAIFPLVARLHGKLLQVRATQDEITMDLNDLHLRADSDSGDGVEVHADAQTTHRLEEKFASQGTASNGPSSDTPLNEMMNRAKNLAGRLQEKVTGRASTRPRITLKLADNSSDQGSPRPRDQINPNRSRNDEDADAHFEHEKDSNDDSSASKRGNLAHNSSQTESSDDSASADANTYEPRANASENSADKSSDQSATDQGGNGGSAHGVGADPDSLFGPTSNPRLGGNGFEISIDARSEIKGPNASGHAYLPPKVRTPLNPNQHSDEPIARASVPQADRAAIQRIFER